MQITSKKISIVIAAVSVFAISGVAIAADGYLPAIYHLLNPHHPPEPVPLIPLNDTGITRGGDSASPYILEDCTSSIGAGQDCSQGRDAMVNNDADGAAGFSFTKLDASGDPLPDQSDDYATTPWSCVQDNVTGLVWEIKTDDAMEHDKDNTYRWGGETASGSGFGTYYNDWTTLVQDSNNNSLCGYNDWRVPTARELESLVHHGKEEADGLAIDTDYFPNTSTLNIIYWSASPASSSELDAWYVDFDVTRATNHGPRTGTHGVRLVRSDSD